MKKNILQQSQTGFTLIETLVAIFIFSMALVALSAVAARGVSSVNRAKEVVVAQYLAQEGAEMVRNVRDNNTLGNIASWDAVFMDCSEDSPCDIDYSSGTPVLISFNGHVLSIENGIYTSSPISSSLVTPFVRTIWVKPINLNSLNQPVEYAVYSNIKWAVGTSSRSIEATTIVTDWQ